MKTTFKFYTVLIFSLFTLSLFAQDKILDITPSIRVNYMYYYKQDTTIMQYHIYPYRLDICDGQSLFYSKELYMRDSSIRVAFDSGKTYTEVGNEVRVLLKGQKWYVVKDFENNIFGRYYTHIREVFRNEQELEIPNWKLYSDTLTIAGYLCNKAVANIMGREWSVWYTKSIPINDGPWLLWGLPGAIIYAIDSNKYFAFKFLDITELKDPTPTIYLTHINKIIKDVSHKDYQYIEKLGQSKDIKFLELDGAGPIEAYNPDGSPAKPNPPIEYVLLSK